MENVTTQSLVPSPTPAPTGKATWLVILQIVFLCIISLVGITGNLIICKKLIRSKGKSSEYFIINLALADLSVCAMGIPLDIYDQLHDTWQYGSFLCKVIWPYQTLVVLVSIMTLTAMSLERHRAIMTPFKPRLKKSDLLKAIAGVWIIGVCVIAPYAYYLIYDGEECVEKWPEKMSGAYYTLSLFIIDYCIPLTIITFCYARAGLKLNKNTQQFRKVNASSPVSNLAQRKRDSRNRRIIKIFSFAVLMFLVCMLPGDCYWMWKSFGQEHDEIESAFAHEDHFKIFANILVYANSAINPFIFGACHFGCLGKFRSARSPHSFRRQRIISFQSEDSNYSQHSRSNLREKQNDELTKINLKMYQKENVRETDV